MNVFITGATGYIGFQVAQTFRRAGHRVLGLTRSRENAERLSRHEIHPIIGSMQEPASYKKAADSCQVIIHTAADYENDSLTLDKQTVENLLTSTRSEPLKTVIYTSGTWVYGNTGGIASHESTPLNPIKVMSWKPDVEEMILGTEGVNGIVIRPGCVYGRQGGMTRSWFDSAMNQETFRVIGNGNHRWAMVHVDDLADAYLHAASSGLESEVFNITDGSDTPVRDLVSAVARVANYKGEIRFVTAKEASAQMGDLAEALAIDQLIDASKAKSLLGWEPRHQSFLDDIDLYFAAWRAFT